MKTRRVPRTGTCDFCRKTGLTTWYDCQISGKHTWANMCEQCHKLHGSDQGTCFRSFEYTGGNEKRKVVKVKELSSLEDLADDYDREVQCPQCNHSFILEMDAHGIIDCAGCGQKLMVRARI